MHAKLDPGSYPDGVKVSDEQMARLPLNRHGWHGDWNYTPRPEPPAQPPPPRPPAREPERPGWAPFLGGAEWSAYAARRRAATSSIGGGYLSAGSHQELLQRVVHEWDE